MGPSCEDKLQSGRENIVCSLPQGLNLVGIVDLVGGLQSSGCIACPDLTVHTWLRFWGPGRVLEPFISFELNTQLNVLTNSFPCCHENVVTNSLSVLSRDSVQ
jgi:hypothetical protein